jgi:hypothetical protein
MYVREFAGAPHSQQPESIDDSLSTFGDNCGQPTRGEHRPIRYVLDLDRSRQRRAYSMCHGAGRSVVSRLDLTVPHCESAGATFDGQAGLLGRRCDHDRRPWPTEYVKQVTVRTAILDVHGQLNK